MALMLFTRAKALQQISIPTYLVGKDWTIILVALAEVLWFECSITEPMILSFGLIALSSVVAACADIRIAISNYSNPYEIATQITRLNVGYGWILLSCFSTAAFVFSTRKQNKFHESSDLDRIPQKFVPIDG